MKHPTATTLYIFLILIIQLNGASAKTSVNTSANTRAPDNKQRTYKDQHISLRFIQLTPRQIGSFYEGREFEKAAVDKLMKACYVTVIIQNLTDDFLWIDTDKWEFTREGKKITQLDRNYWNKQWDEIGLKQAHRSTFSWTLMPAERDLYPLEGVGGRVPIKMQTKPFTVVLNFPTGENKQGKMKSVKIDQLTCKQDNEK